MEETNNNIKVNEEKIEETVESPVTEVIHDPSPAPDRVQVPSLDVPVYLNTSTCEWPDDDTFFYLVASNGMFKCRNHKFFTSCVKTDKFPSGLENQREFLQLKYPKIPQKLFEKVVGFFSNIYDIYKSESIVLLYWNRDKDCYYMVVPEQFITETVYEYEGHGFFGKMWKNKKNKHKKDKYTHSSFSLDVEYTIPEPKAHLIPVATIHCHASLGAFASTTDEHDEKHFAGVHIVVGKIDDAIPDINIEAVVDGVRFRVAEDLVLEGFTKKNKDIPKSWMDQMKVVQEKKKYGTTHYLGRGDFSEKKDEGDSEFGHYGEYCRGGSQGSSYGGSGYSYGSSGYSRGSSDYSSGYSGSGYGYGSGYGSSYRQKLDAEAGE